MGPLQASLAEQMTKLRGDAPPALVDAVVERVALPGGEVVRARPRSFDAVREAEALAGPGRPTPYWASQWPSGVALARFVAGRDLSGMRVLEVGCGLGLPSVAAARAGASVTATDACPEAVVYAAHNLALNGLEGEAAAADWRDLPGMDGAPWDLVIGADLLYRPDNHESLQALLPSLTSGEVWIADPGRGGCRDFLAVARSRWQITSVPDPENDEIRTHLLARKPVSVSGHAARREQ
jgi:predicted nicotinamide N-methyase